MSVEDSDSEQSDSDLLDLSLVLYDGKYVDQRFAQFSIQTSISSMICNQTNG